MIKVSIIDGRYTILKEDMKPLDFEELKMIHQQLGYTLDRMEDMNITSGDVFTKSIYRETAQSLIKSATVELFQADYDLPANWRKLPMHSSGVYLVQITNGMKKIKIGSSVQPRVRVKTLWNNGGCQPMRLVAFIQTEHFVALEKAMHNLFIERRINLGEYFNITPEIAYETIRHLMSEDN